MALLVQQVQTGNAGANPIEFVEQSTGEWTLRFLLLSLAATPVAQILKSAWPIRLRRMVGLYAFFYATAHLLAYLVLDQYLNWRDVLADLAEKPFIVAGFLSFLIMLPLAVTSNRLAVKRLGKRWKDIHNWVYFAAVSALLHYVWLAKGDRIEPLIYLLVLLFLLAYRLTRLLGSSSR